MIGYALNDTLSEFGGVSRGICECNASGFLEKIVEVKKIEESEGEIAGVTTTGHHYSLQGNETVSMNIWALTPAVFQLLERQFALFLKEHGGDFDAEFLISSALNEQIETGAASLKVIAARDRWFGVTYQADKPTVVREIGELVKQGVYPNDLTTWFQGIE
jgi:hypothetical protein